MNPTARRSQLAGSPGVWEISARITLSGLGREMPLRLAMAPTSQSPVWTGKPPHLLVPLITESGQLGIDVSGGHVPQTERLNGPTPRRQIGEGNAPGEAAVPGG